MSWEARFEHLTGEELATWSSPPHAYRVRHAYDLSTGCNLCWSAIAAVEPTEPRRLKDPLLRVIARVCHPKVDLSLPSQAIRPFLHGRVRQTAAPWGFRPDDLPFLLLQESIALSRERRDSDGEDAFSLPSALAKLLIETPETARAGTDLQVNVDCAAIDFYFSNDAEKAEAALDSAKTHFTVSCDPSTEVNLKLAELKVACLKARVDPRLKATALSKLSEISGEFKLIRADPVRRFEIVSEVIQSIHCVNVADDEDGATWALSELGLGPWANEIHRLNGLFHKAKFAAVAVLLPDLQRTVATELDRSLKSIYEHGGYLSLGHGYALLGKLRCDASLLEDALQIYASLGLEGDFLETWKMLDRVDVQSRSRVSDLAYHAFGQDLTHRMVREVSGVPEPERTDKVLA